MSAAEVNEIHAKASKDNGLLYGNKLCRSCLGEVQKDYFWLESYYLDKKLLDIYKNVVSIEIDINESLPKKLCISCYDSIIRFDMFKNKALESEKILSDNLLLYSTDYFNNYIENKAAICENENKTENYVQCDVNDTVETSESEDEKPISERLNLLNGTVNNVGNDLTEGGSDDKDEDTDYESLQKRPRVKLKKRSIKRSNYKDHVDENVSEKKTRERRKVSCKECGKLIATFKMDNHMRTHTKEKPYNCEKCGARFSEKSNLNRHIKIHGEDRPYECAICGKGFLRPSSREIHELTVHNSEKKIICALCGKAFKHQYFLKKHMTNIHNKGEVKIEVEGSGYPCSICKNIYRTKSSLKVHEMKHDQPKAFLCNICGNAYSTKAILDNHQKVHTGEKNFSCSVCDKKFRFLNTLKTHTLVHSGEKPLSCPLCHQKFRQHSHLNTHVRGQHSTARPFQCSFCSKTFKQSSNLTVHTRIHTGETPFHCDLCQKGFYDSSNFKKHMKGHMVKHVPAPSWENSDLKMECGAFQTG